ncbi:MAG TPA: cell division protein FtsA, partial [Alphaproteobacteria bacterium]|nr:cell division protein FtsA [Alphaproteobacteria bacterium]
IDERDVRNAVAAARAKCSVRGADIMFSAPVSYAVDHTHDILDPRGMIGSRLGARVLVVSAMRGPIENLELCVQRCHLDVQDRVLSGLASGIATTVPDERKLGTVVVDIGGGTTSLTVFAQGQMIHTDRIALGGNHITTDVARGLSTTVSQAERLKTLYGSVIPGAHDERDTIVVTRVGENDAYSHIKAPRKSLTSIIRPRAEEILEIVRDRLVNCGYDKISGRGLVITGGSAPLNGLRELASQIFGRQARLGRPLRMSGLTEANNGGAFAACAGLVLRAALEANRTGAPEVLPLEEPVAPWPVKKLFGVSRWIKERF